MEQVKMSPKGFMFTRGPGNYKIPGFGDIPIEFNVTLLKGSVNEKAVYSSKVTFPCVKRKKGNHLLWLFIFYHHCSMDVSLLELKLEY